MFTEFSGSTCAEAAMESIAAEVGVAVDFVSAADISKQCRSVIMDTRRGLNYIACNDQLTVTDCLIFQVMLSIGDLQILSSKFFRS